MDKSDLKPELSFVPIVKTNKTMMIVTVTETPGTLLHRLKQLFMPKNHRASYVVKVIEEDHIHEADKSNTS